MQTVNLTFPFAAFVGPKQMVNMIYSFVLIVVLHHLIGNRLSNCFVNNLELRCLFYH
jgi:hypothetical protein